MHLPISILCDRGRGKKTVETKALVDSGAGGTFIDQNFARTKGFRLQNLEHPITVYNVDGTLNKRGTIIHFVETNVKIGGRTQEIRFLVSGLGRQKIILGFPWLEKENPAIDWKKATLDWPSEERIRKPKYRLQSRNRKHTSRPIIEQVYNDDDRFNSPVNPILNDEPNLILPMNDEPCSGDSCPQINATFTASAQFAQQPVQLYSCITHGQLSVEADISGATLYGDGQLSTAVSCPSRQLSVTYRYLRGCHSHTNHVYYGRYWSRHRCRQQWRHMRGRCCQGHCKKVK